MNTNKNTMIDVQSLSFKQLNDYIELLEKERKARSKEQFDSNVRCIKVALRNFINNFPTAEIVLPYVNEEGCKENIDLTMYVDDLDFIQ